MEKQLLPDIWKMGLADTEEHSFINWSFMDTNVRLGLQWWPRALGKEGDRGKGTENGHPLSKDKHKDTILEITRSDHAGSLVGRVYITRDSYPCTPPLPVSSPDNVWSCVGGVDPFQSSLKHRDKENKRIAKHVDSRSRTQILSTQFMKKIVHSEKFIKKTKSIHVDVNASAPAASLFDVSHKLTSPPYIPPPTFVFFGVQHFTSWVLDEKTCRFHFGGHELHYFFLRTPDGSGRLIEAGRIT